MPFCRTIKRQLPFARQLSCARRVFRGTNPRPESRQTILFGRRDLCWYPSLGRDVGSRSPSHLRAFGAKSDPVSKCMSVTFSILQGMEALRPQRSSPASQFRSAPTYRALGRAVLNKVIPNARFPSWHLVGDNPLSSYCFLPAVSDFSTTLRNIMTVAC